MSIEKLLADQTAALAANTAAITALTEVWGKLVVQGDKAVADSKAGKGVTAAGKSVVEPASSKGAAASTVSSKMANESQQTGKTDVGGITAEDISKLVVSTAAKLGRDPTLELLKPFGATSGKTVKPEDYVEVKAALEAATAEDLT